MRRGIGRIIVGALLALVCFVRAATLEPGASVVVFLLVYLSAFAGLLCLFAGWDARATWLRAHTPPRRRP